MEEYADPEQSIRANEIAKSDFNIMRGLVTTAGGFAPGAGLLEAAGYYPNIAKGYEPSLLDNLRQGNYGSAGLQSVGALGDMMLMTGMLAPAGMALKGISTAGKTAKIFGEAPKLIPENVGQKATELFNFSDEAKEIWKQGKPKFVRFKNPEVEKFNQQNAELLQQGKISSAEFRKRNAELMPVQPFKEVPELPSEKDIVFALGKKADKGILNVTTEIPEGTLVGTRLDIPSYNEYGVYIPSIHAASSRADKGGNILAYGQTAVLKNVDFVADPATFLKVATREKTKVPEAKMIGEWVNHNPQEVQKLAKKLIDDPEWSQLGFNPDRASHFYDKTDTMPVVKADEIIQIGALVLGKNVKKAKPNDPRFTVLDKETKQPIKDPMGENVTYAALPVMPFASLYAGEDDNPLKNELLK